jgi:23S rRNA (adenine2503-C2)-methyltransferase
MTENLFDLNFSAVQTLVQELGEPDYRADQIWQGLYKDGWSRPEEFTTLPRAMRSDLSERFDFGNLTKERELVSSDGYTRKYLYRLKDGAAVETVLMEYDQRKTVCVSSQVGCAMGCSFCATGNMGLSRNLSQGEIIEQVLKTDEVARSTGSGLTNVVFMGMGEPFHNYEAVLSAVNTLNDANGFGMGMRRFTISTVGLVPGIERFTVEKSQINLALSLHAADDELRSSLVPINNRYPISELMAACDRYIQETNRRITIEWALIEGLNDNREQALKLTQLLGDKLFHVNLIQLNPVAHYPGQPTQDDSARKFQDILQEAGIACTIRLRRGIDIQAGCGQLANNRDAED